ncbi:hypothetical protein ABBQ32_004324 [Trebouxia sp. C0010 RCD-2024]
MQALPLTQSGIQQRGLMSSSEYTFKRVQVCLPEPSKLVVMCDKRKRQCVCLCQVYKSCLDGLLPNYQAFYRVCSRLTKHQSTLLSGQDKQLLVALAGMDVSVPHVAVVSLAVCCRALKLCKVPAAVLHAFDDIRLKPASQVVLGLPEHILAAHAQPSPNPVQLQMTTPFPVTLPECALPADFKKQHGLLAKLHKHLVRRAVLAQHMGEFKSFSTSPFQLNRKGIAHSSRTWQNSEKHVYLFLGYCHHYQQVSQPTLQLFLSSPLIAQFVSFHIAAGHSQLYIRNFPSCAKCVLRWWQSKPGGNHPSFVAGLEWLQTLGLQVADQLPRPSKDPKGLADIGKWMCAADLVHTIHGAEQQSQAQMQQQGVTVETSRDMHDAALAAMIFSHLPPVRLSCIRSLVGPAYLGPCLHPDCKEPSCEGNRLSIMSESPLLMRISLPHHKNARKWGKAVIEFDVPSDLAQLLHTYLGAPRKALLEHHLLIGDACPYVFMDMHGRGFVAAAVLTLYWQKWLVSRGGVPMNPSMCRQVFVDERQSDSATAGPSNQGAAMVMGHSVKQWDKWYDMQYHPRLAQNAVDGMQSWRAAMLQSHTLAAPDLTLSTALHCGHVLVSDSEESQYQSCCSDSDSDIDIELD